MSSSRPNPEEDDDPSLLETSLPTEFSDFHEDPDLEAYDWNKPLNLSEPEITDAKRLTEALSRAMHEKKQHEHEMQMVKLQLSQKTLLFENTKSDLVSNIKELKDALHDVSHQRKILQAKLDSQTKSYSKLNTENQELLLKCQSLTDTLSSFRQLKAEHASILPKYRQQQEDIEKFKSLYQDHSDLIMKYKKCVTELNDVRQQIQVGNYKIENFDSVKNERDFISNQMMDFKKKYMELDTSYQVLMKERNDLNSQLTSAHQSIDLLKRDKEYLNLQIADLNSKLLNSEDKLITAHHDAAEAKRVREELYEKYVADRVRQLQSECDVRLADMQNEVKLKMFEAERSLLVHEETEENLRKCQTENEKLTKKLELATKEFYSLQAESERQVSELKMSLEDKKSRLDVYEKMEKEMDDVVMMAAEVDTHVPIEERVSTASKRRLQQSVQLARRVLALEKENARLLREQEHNLESIEHLKRESELINSVNDASINRNKMYSLIKAEKDKVAECESKIKELTAERESLIKTRVSMQRDIEKLLNNREEFVMMQKYLEKMSSNQSHQKEFSHLQDPSRPITITTDDPPSWLSKLKIYSS